MVIRCDGCGKRLAEVTPVRDELSYASFQNKVTLRLAGRWYCDLVDGLAERDRRGDGRWALAYEDWWQIRCQSSRCSRVYRGRADRLVEMVKAARDSDEAIPTVVLRAGDSYGELSSDLNDG